MGRAVCSVGVFLLMLLDLESACAQIRPEPIPLDTTTWPAGIDTKNDLPKSKAYEYTFSDIPTSSIEKWLSYVRVKIPVDVSGSLSGWIWVQRSERGWLDLSGYRIEGRIVSPKLRVDRWEFKDSLLRFGFSNNVWYVGRLSGDVFSREADERIGTANFAATISTDDRLLQLSGGITQSQLKPLLKAFDVDLEIVNDKGELNVAANVPLALSRDPAAWKLTANIDLGGVRSVDFPRSSLVAQFNVDEGAWNIPAGTLLVIDQPIRFEAKGDLEQRLPYIASITGKQLAIAQLMRSVKLPELTSRLSGNVDVVGKVQGSRDRPIEAATFAVRSKSIAIDEVVFDTVRLDGIFDNWKVGRESLQLSIKSASLAGGKLRGTIGWESLSSLKEVIPDQARVGFESVDLERLPSSLTGVELSGLATGRIEFAAHFNDGEKLRRWKADSQMSVENLFVANVQIGNTSFSASKVVDADTIKATLENSDRSLQAEVDVTTANSLKGDKFGWVKKYDAKGSVEKFRTLLPLNGRQNAVPLFATGNFELHGTPSDWPSTGHLELAELRVALSEQALEFNRVVANIREDVFRLERFQIRDERGGHVAGSALIRRDHKGEHLLNLRVGALEMETYINNLAPAELQGLMGTVDLETRLKKSATSDDLLSDWAGTVRGEVLDLAFRSIPIGSLAISGDVTEKQIDSKIVGRVLGGELAMTTTLSQAELKGPISEGSHFPVSASLSGVDLQRLMSLIKGPRAGSRYSGIANFGIDSTDQTEDWKIRIGMPHFHYGRRELAKELDARLTYRNSKVLTVEDLSGRLAGGRVNIRGEVQTDNAEPSGSLRFTAEDMNLQSLATMVYPPSAEQLSGVVSYRGNMRIGKEIALLGSSHIKNAALYGLSVQDVRNDLLISLSMGGALKEISANKIHGVAIGGRLDGEARIRGGSRYSLDAKGKIGGGKLDQLSRALGFEKIVGTGNFDASTRLTSNDAFNIAALTGPMQLNFTNGDVKSVPVLSEIGRLVPVLQLASTDIKSGTMQGQFGQGQFRFPALLLNSDAFYLIASGSTSLRSGGLDIDGLLQTGGGINEQVAQGVTQKLFTLAFPELLLLAEVNDLVRNRTVYFHIGGSPKHPVVQPKTAQTIGKVLLQNLSRNLIVIPSASTAIATSSRD